MGDRDEAGKGSFCHVTKKKKKGEKKGNATRCPITAQKKRRRNTRKKEEKGKTEGNRESYLNSFFHSMTLHNKGIVP